MKKLFLLDGHALVYRAHYAFMTRPLLNSKGQNVSAVNGFLRTVLEVLKKEKPSHLAVAFDLPTPTFRHTMYDAYKANRDAQPEDITLAFPYILRILDGMKIPMLTVDGYEADDVIGTIAKKAEQAGFDEILMMTPDKDYGQLVSEKIKMYKPARSGNEVEVWGVKEVLENWQIQRVDQVIDMLALQGDAVDNIPGIKGIGPKTAATLLQQFGTVEEIIANVHLLKGKQQETVRENAEMGLLSKTLARIDIDVPIELDEKAYEVHTDYDIEVLSEVFKELEFRTIAREVLGSVAGEGTVSQKGEKSDKPQQTDLFGETVATTATTFPSVLPSHSVATKNISNTPHEYHLIDTEEARKELISLLEKQSVVCFDTETTNVDANQAEMVGISFAWQASEAYYVPVPKNPKDAAAVIHEFKAFFENPHIKKIGQNIKYDMILLKWYGVEAQGVHFDTMIAHYLLEPDLRHGMNYMSESYLQYAPVSIETLIGKGKNQLSMRDIAVAKVKDYAAEDADVTFQLYQFFEPKLTEADQRNLFDTVEMPLVKVLCDLEYEGIRVDADFLNSYSQELAVNIQKAEKTILETANFTFNVGSPKQVGEVLFDRMKLPYRWKKTGKSDQYSTDEEKLSELAENYPIAQQILEYRSLTKLQSTYVEALPRMINPRTGRIHSSFNQALAATGRLSSNNPNLQNIPIKTAEGRKIREAFKPRSEEYILMAADYSQIELRLIAEIANDEAMLDAFQRNLDIHTATAAKVYGVELDKVSSDQRRNAKTVNFSIIYGAGSTNLSQQLKIPRAEAKILIENYFNQYKGLKNYMEQTVESARSTGYVSTLLGRKRHLRDIDSRNQLARSNSERVAINSPIQGTAADLIKVAMINIHKAFREQNLKSKMILQVHDELLFDVYLPEKELVQNLVSDLMRNAMPNLRVPIEVGVGFGQNWLEAH